MPIANGRLFQRNQPLADIAIVDPHRKVSLMMEGSLHKLVSSVVLLLGLASSAAAQSVPEGVHRLADGPSAMCGIVGTNATELVETARQSPDLRPVTISSDRFELFEGGDPVRFQLVATLPAEKAFPAVSCRELYETGGALRMKRSMRCDADRTDCDALFQEFQALDAEFKRLMQGEGR